MCVYFVRTIRKQRGIIKIITLLFSTAKPIAACEVDLVQAN